jgi:hypothetical protein
MLPAFAKVNISKAFIIVSRVHDGNHCAVDHPSSSYHNINHHYAYPPLDALMQSPYIKCIVYRADGRQPGTSPATSVLPPGGRNTSVASLPSDIPPRPRVSLQYISALGAFMVAYFPAMIPATGTRSRSTQLKHYISERQAILC